MDIFSPSINTPNLQTILPLPWSWTFVPFLDVFCTWPSTNCIHWYNWWLLTHTRPYNYVTTWSSCSSPRLFCSGSLDSCFDMLHWAARLAVSVHRHIFCGGFLVKSSNCFAVFLSVSVTTWNPSVWPVLSITEQTFLHIT